jgi:hypothetical protein
MTTLDKAVHTFGFENPITITIAYLEEQGKHELAEQLYEECEELAHPHWAQDDDLDLDEEWGDDGNLEAGFDPYEGCYTYDC